MEIINSYFDKIVFFKTDKKENYTIYAASISSSFGDGSKTYALAFVPVHMAILDRGYLKDLHWQNFQTRKLSNGWKMQNQRWDLRNLKGLPTPMFNVVERNETKTKYMCETEPLEMVLIHDPKKKSIYQYHNRINMLAALSTFSCVLNFVEGHEMQATRYVEEQPILPHQSSMGFSRTTNIPISSLAVRPPKQSPLYRSSDISEDTTYVPRNEGTKYASNSSDIAEGSYDFNQSTIVGNTGYRSLSLEITIPKEAPVERSGRTDTVRRQRNDNRVPKIENEYNEEINDSFELL